jgi:hypothetical protein
MPKRAKPVEMAAGAAPGADAETGIIGPRLTVEAVLYAAILVCAALLRLIDLGRWPLLSSEATQALAAWRFLQGQPLGVRPTPFIFDGALVSFFAFGASDGVARLFPALLGTALVLTPVAFRRRLGRWGALAAAFALAVSPTLVYYSRMLAGAMPALAGLAAVLVAVELTGRGERLRAVILGVAGLGIALTSSPWTYSFLLAALLFFGLAWMGKRQGDPWPGWETAEQQLRNLAGDKRAWGALALLLALLSTAMGMSLSGLQGSADLLGTWLGRLAPGGAGRSFLYPLGILAYYELGLAALGIAGLVIALRRGDRWAGFLGLWAGLATLLAVWSGARDATPVVMAVLPLAMLSGVAVEAIVARLQPANWAWVGICLATLSVVTGFWWLEAATYASLSPDTVNVNRQLVGALALATPLFLVAAGAVFWFWVGRRETTWAVTLLGLGLAACLLVRSSAFLNFSLARDAREPIASAPTSVSVRTMVAFVEEWSLRRAMDTHAMTVAVDTSLDPVVPWYLRDFPALRLSAAPFAEPGAGAIVTSVQPDAPAPSGYAGTRFTWRTSASPALGSGRRALSWWLMRDGGGSVQGDAIEVWVQP